MHTKWFHFSFVTHTSWSPGGMPPKTQRRKVSRMSPVRREKSITSRTEIRNVTMEDSIRISRTISVDPASNWSFDKKDSETLKRNVQSFMSTVAQGIKPFRREYRLIRSIVPEGSKDAFVRNESKNRYSDILLLDATRVKIKDYDSEYIHASRVAVGDHTFLCTQGPMSNTAVAFWKMVAQENVKLVVMLCRLTEEGKEKACDYFPRNVGDKKSMADITVTCTKKDPPSRGITVTTLQYSCGKRKETVVHLSFDDWPDQNAPNSLYSSLLLMKMARERSGNGPIVVHCSAGVGRTGCFVGLELARHHATIGSFNMEATVKTLRNQRMQALQCDIQYLYVCRGLLECLLRRGIIKKENFSRFSSEYDEYVKRKKCSDQTCISIDKTDIGQSLDGTK